MFRCLDASWTLFWFQRANLQVIEWEEHTSAMAQHANAIRLSVEKILDSFSLGIGINNLKSASVGGRRIHLLAEMKNV
jgi:hypothetical protein